MTRINVRNVDDSGRVTIPKRFRECLNLKYGDLTKIELDEENKRVIITKDESEFLKQQNEVKMEHLEYVYNLAKEHGIVPDEIQESMDEWGF